MKKALVTLAIGEKYLQNFQNYSMNNWKEYAIKHGYDDIIVITESLDTTERGAKRSPAWQKCLILDHPAVKDFDQVAWVDSDIMINPESPDIFENVPLHKIGCVDAYGTPTQEDYHMSLKRLYNFWDSQNIEYTRNLTPTEFHQNFGLMEPTDKVVQTGVMVLSPTHHNKLFLDVYNRYEDKGEAHWNYEMRPLSYEIITHNLAHWICPKFNTTWLEHKQLFYPFLETIATTLGADLYRHLLQKAVTTTYLNSYFLHFAASAEEMPYVATTIKSIYQL